MQVTFNLYFIRITITISIKVFYNFKFQKRNDTYIYQLKVILKKLIEFKIDIFFKNTREQLLFSYSRFICNIFSLN